MAIIIKTWCDKCYDNQNIFAIHNKQDLKDMYEIIIEILDYSDYEVNEGLLSIKKCPDCKKGEN